MQMSFSWRIRITGYTYILQRHPSGASINLHSSRFRNLQAYGLIGVIYSLENHGRSVSIKSKYGRETASEIDGDSVCTNLDALSCGAGYYYITGRIIDKAHCDSTVIISGWIHRPLIVDADSNGICPCRHDKCATAIVNISIPCIG